MCRFGAYESVTFDQGDISLPSRLYRCLGCGFGFTELLLISQRASKAETEPGDSLISSANELLVSLPAPDRVPLLAGARVASFAPGSVVMRAADSIEYAYFPTSGTVSLRNGSSDAAHNQVAIVGREGFVGSALITGWPSATYDAVVEIRSSGLLIPARILRQEMARRPLLRAKCLAYIEYLSSQLAQTIVCTRAHPIRQQFCRWLLATMDRIDGDTIPLSQEKIADDLGVHRQAILQAAQVLSDSGVLAKRRGSLQVLSRALLEAESCGCHGVLKNRLADFRRIIRARGASDSVA